MALTTEVTSDELAKLFGVTPHAVTDLGKREIIVKGEKRSTWLLQPSVSGYVKHLREKAAARGRSDAAAARARLGEAQAALAEARAGSFGELVEAAEVEKFWRGKLRAFRNSILAIPSRVRDLSARQSVSLTQERRAALTELADHKTA